MAAINLATQLFVDGAWTTYPAYSADGWSVRVGPDVESGLQPNQTAFTLNNDDLSMDPTNVASPLYGKIGRNTPARLLIGGVGIFYAEASSWKPERSIEHQPGAGRGRSSIAVTAEGMLRRLGRWDDDLDSPITRQTSGYPNLLGYWPLEDPSGSQRLAQWVAGAQLGTYSGTVTLAGDDGAGGSGKTLTIGADGLIGGTFAGSAGNGFWICFSAKLDALPTSATYDTLYQFSDTLGRVWRWRVNNVNLAIDITDPNGTLITSLAGGYGATPLTGWVRYQMRVTVAGSTVTYQPNWYPQDSPVISGFTGTFASTATGRPRDWVVVGNPWTDGAAYGHVFATSNTVIDLTDGTATSSFNGYLGERAGVRFSRLMDQLGLAHYVDGDATKSTPMGRQKPGKILDLLTECAVTDAGLLYDEPLDIALTFRMANALINQTPALALTYNVDIAPPLIKTVDDVGVANDITVTNYDGTAVHLEETDGRLSTAPPPAGVGRYKKPLAVSVRGVDQLGNRANWELVQGTLDRPRYQSVVIDLLKFPSYRPAVLGLRPGDIITLAGVEPDTIVLRVMTIELQGGAVAYAATLTCLPGDLWQTGTYNDGIHRYDSRSTTLGSAVTSTATTLTFSVASSTDLWSQTSAYDVLIAGERIGIPAGGMSAATGTGPYTQTATGVTRSKNGVVKAQAAAAAIHIATPGRASPL